MEWLIEVGLKYPWRVAVGTFVVLAAIGSFIWYQGVWQSPQRIFGDMLVNNLAAMSVTKFTSVGSGAQRIEQTIRLELDSSNAADWLVTATQNKSSVTTEEIGTRDGGYLRYMHIQSNTSKPATYVGILGKWAKGDDKTDTDLSQLFAGTLLDVQDAPLPPIGNLPPTQRENLLTFIRDQKVFTADYNKIKQEVVSGQNVDTFSVTVDLAAYVRLTQAFAHDLGLTTLDQLDANDYQGVKPVISLSIDRFSHQLVRAAYAPSGFTQTYGDWGLMTTIVVPTQAITATDLQTRLQAVTKR